MIRHNKPTLGEEEWQAAVRAIRSGQVSQGREVELFEDEFCDFLRLPHGHAVAFSSGSASLFLALWVLNAKGKRVSIPVYSCSALRNAVAMASGTAVPVDISGDSPNVDPRLANGCACDIAIVAHMFGIPSEITAFKTADIIEDCAQALGSTIGGIQAGLHGKIGIFSFYATKLMTSGGQGGMLVSKDRSLVDQVRDYRQFDQRQDDRPRFNFQMTDIQAAIGRVQLSKLPEFLKRRELIFDRYKKMGIDLIDVKDGDALRPVRYRAVLKTDDPGKVISALSEAGVRSIVPIEDWELLGDRSLFQNAYSLARSTVSLPLYPSLTDAEADLICRRLTL